MQVTATWFVGISAPTTFPKENRAGGKIVEEWTVDPQTGILTAKCKSRFEFLEALVDADAVPGLATLVVVS